jgi:hypothetical protein
MFGSLLKEKEREREDAIVLFLANIEKSVDYGERGVG